MNRFVIKINAEYPYLCRTFAREKQSKEGEYMDFQTKVELPAGLPPVSHAERILLMGSCFAENMGRLLAENKFRVDMNPFGILYNPLSVSTALVEILKGKVYQEKDLFLYKECWHSPMHHGLFSASSPEEVLEKINTRLSPGPPFGPRT